MNSYLRNILTVIIISRFVELSIAKSGITNPVLQDNNPDPAGEQAAGLIGIIIPNDKNSIQPFYNPNKSEAKFSLPEI